MDAFFLIDKQSWKTSFDVLREMRKILWIKKIGHTGTLDPLATGCLLVATGNYTKLIPLVEKHSKAYLATIMLDGSSASYDSDTEVEHLSDEQQEYFGSNLSHEDIQTVIHKNFSWDITQIPPKYSALKINGKRALDRTLAGEDVVMKERKATILGSNIISYNYPKLVVEFIVSAGTYIRSIAHDLGQILGTGWYLSWLRRTAIGKISISDAAEISELSEESKLDIHQIFADKIFLMQDEEIYRRLVCGQRVRAEFSFPENTDIILSDGIYIRYIIEYKNGVIHPRKKIT